MEEDVGVKATVTRLRRRMSMEQSEDGSSPAPSTPTKKRGGKLAAKPQLDLIDENAQVSSPRKTRRRSLAADAEEKPITPSRRSTRIKSNTSIVSETLSVQATDSPRAKRAARRNSQAGSDNEAPITPARQTRRTRKDSASSVENQDSSTLSRPLPVAEMVIEEEPETDEKVQKAVNKSKSSPTKAADELTPDSTRKSRRLSEKRKSGTYKSDPDSPVTSLQNKSLNTSTAKEKTSSETNIPPNSLKSNENDDNLSESNMSLLQKLDLQNNKSIHNKSTSDLKTEETETKRHRTESWPTVRSSGQSESNHFSDNEVTNKKKGKSRISVSSNNSLKINKSNSSMNETKTSLSFLDTSSKRNKTKSESSFTEGLKNDDQATEILTPEENSINATKTKNNKISSEMELLFQCPPSKVEATVCFEDYDSNSRDSANINSHLDSEDQCVPVIKHDLQEKLSSNELSAVSNEKEIVFPNQVGNDQTTDNEKEVKADINESCEPMDVDETIGEEVVQISQLQNVVARLSEEVSSLQQTEVEQQSLSVSQHATIQSQSQIEGETNKSKRKSSASLTLDRSKDDNKSTLILSQIKDVSCTSENLKSPKPTYVNGHDILSKSDVNFDDHNKKASKNNLSLNDIRGTPKPNIIQKLSIQTSTPITMQQDDFKTKKNEQTINAKKNKSKFSKSINDSDLSESDSDEAETSVEKNKFLDDEAEEASDDYQSGDSQDEEERQYQKENEIVERGETLDSDDDVSNDTDYEKDSFVVSSDAEDDDLLSGSGDDLSMSDKELSMSKKSKMKFNERKLKEQKKASREMFESRHKLNSSDQKSPTPKTKQNRMRIDSTMSEEEVPKPKKNNRMRLDSTLETSTQPQEDAYVSLNKSKKNNTSMEVSSLDANNKQEDANVSLNKSENNDKSMQDLTLNTTDKQEVMDKSLNKSKKRDKSTCDATLDTIDKQEITSNSMIKSKKNNKSMQDSLCNESAINEKEISLFNGSLIEKTDPFQVCVKLEPKTPQKDIDISVVQFTDRQEIENVQITENNSILNQTGTDPLQATMAEEDASDSSESEEIMQNYDSVLNDLNNQKKTKLNNNNISLNIDKKAKKSRSEPIVDQLNLTHTKNIKKKYVPDSKNAMMSMKNTGSDNEESSNSIDLQLLFSEDNSASEDDQVTKAKTEDDNMFIPLKKSPGSTDIRQSHDNLNKSKETNVSLNESKKNKKHSFSESTVQESDKSKDFNISLNESSKKIKKQSISDCTVDSGNLNKSQDFNVSLNESRKKKKHSISESTAVQESDMYNTEAVSSESAKKMKKKRKSSLSAQDAELPEGNLFFIDTTGTLQDDNGDHGGDINDSSINILYESKKKKKDNKLKSSLNEIDGPRTADDVTPAMTPKSDKKKKKTECLGTTDVVTPAMTPKSDKKKKKTECLEVTEQLKPASTADDVTPAMTPKSDKKKKKTESLGTADDVTPAMTPKSDKKKKKTESLGTADDVTPAMTPKSDKKKKKTESVEVMEEVKPATTPKSDKKKKRTECLGLADEVQPTSTPKSDKKKEKKISQKIESLDCIDDSDDAPDETPYHSQKATEADLNNTETVSESAETGSGKKKKKKKKKSKAVNLAGSSGDAKDNISNSKKRKRKSSNAEGSEVSGDILDSVETVNLNELAGSQKKKRKISHNESNISSGPKETKHDKKKKNRDVIFPCATPEWETTEPLVKKNKKRKHREDDGDIKQTKVSKDNSFQEVHVTRLPDSILNQLDDKPRKVKGNQVISTSNFLVENARQKRAKPSNYLEESIYLDADSPKIKKEKPRIKKPKVLPFIPTALTSESGFTSHFKINKLSVATKFEAQPLSFSKESYLQKKPIKKLGTYDRYKKQMHHKISKF